MASSAGLQLVAGRIPGERIATTKEESDSSTFTTSAATILSVDAPVVNGRTYAVVAYFKCASTVDNDDVACVLREDSSGGTAFQSDRRELSTDDQGNNGQTFHLYGEYTADATETKTFVVTAVRDAGSGNVRMEAASSRPAYLYVNYLSG